MKCEICNKGIWDGVTLHRVNDLGVVGIWRCKNCLTDEQKLLLDPECVKICEIINPGG